MAILIITPSIRQQQRPGLADSIRAPGLRVVVVGLAL
jgi:hypothetical protein